MKNKMKTSKIKALLVTIVLILMIFSSIFWTFIQNSGVEAGTGEYTREFYQAYICENGHISTATGTKITAWNCWSYLDSQQTSIDKCAYAYGGSSGATRL